MDPEAYRAKPYRRSAFVGARPTEAEEVPATAGETERDEEEDPLLFLSKPTGWALSVITTQAELISTLLLSLSSPFLSIFFQSRAVPSRVAHGAAAVLRGLAIALVCTAYAIACLTFILALALLLGVLLVRLWVEEPVLLRRPLHFDYTQPQPHAVSLLRKAGARGRAVPAGHSVSVSLSLVMPESDFNRHVGIFQVSAEAISSNGRVIETSTQPCMLRFRSLPVRMMRTLAMAFPLLIGARTEAQQIVFDVLKYREGSQKTAAIGVRLLPRSGTFDLPQIYDAEVLLRSRLPRKKEVVHNWKWTFYIWVSFNLYVLLLVLLFCCFRPFDLWRHGRDRVPAINGGAKNSEDFINALGGWRERKRMSLSEVDLASSEAAEGSAVRAAGESSEVLIEDSEDSVN